MRTFRQIIAIGILANVILPGPRAVLGSDPQDFLSLSLKQHKEALVERVLSVDVIRIEGGEKIKLIGIRAPEAPKRIKESDRDKYGFIIEEESPLTPVNEQAFDYVRSLLEGKTVRLEFDAQKRSSDFKTLAYVFLTKDQTFVNTEILRQGFAYLKIRPPNTKYADLLREAYKEARREKRGLQGE